MAGPDDLPEGWEIAGFETSSGDWENTEESNYVPNDDELADSYQIVVSFTDDSGEKHYYSVMGGVEGWDGLEDAIDDLEGEYG